MRIAARWAFSFPPAGAPGIRSVPDSDVGGRFSASIKRPIKSNCSARVSKRLIGKPAWRESHANKVADGCCASAVMPAGCKQARPPVNRHEHRSIEHRSIPKPYIQGEGPSLFPVDFHSGMAEPFRGLRVTPDESAKRFRYVNPVANSERTTYPPDPARNQRKHPLFIKTNHLPARPTHECD